MENQTITAQSPLQAIKLYVCSKVCYHAFQLIKGKDVARRLLPSYRNFVELVFLCHQQIHFRSEWNVYTVVGLFEIGNCVHKNSMRRKKKFMQRQRMTEASEDAVDRKICYTRIIIIGWLRFSAREKVTAFFSICYFSRLYAVCHVQICFANRSQKVCFVVTISVSAGAKQFEIQNFSYKMNLQCLKAAQ